MNQLEILNLDNNQQNKVKLGYMSEHFDTIIKDNMQEYYTERDIKNPNSKDLAKAFIDFYFREIGIFIHNINEDELEEGFDCDGKADLGIDFIIKKEDGSLIIYQSKYKGGRSTLSSDEISNFFQISRRILNKKFLNEFQNSLPTPEK